MGSRRAAWRRRAAPAASARCRRAGYATWPADQQRIFLTSYIASLEADEAARRGVATATATAAENAAVRQAAMQTAIVNLGREGITGIASIINAENNRAELAAQRASTERIAALNRDAASRDAALAAASNERIALMRGSTQGITATTAAPMSDNTKLLIAGAVLAGLYLLSQRRRGR